VLVKSPPRKAAAATLVHELREEILSGRLPAGERIAGELELMTRFAVSRATVREALSELRVAGLVQSRPGARGGAFVAVPNLDRISEMMSDASSIIAAGDHFPYDEVCVATFVIEAACCRMVVKKRDPDVIVRLARVIEMAALAPNEPKAFFDAATAFNRELWRAAGNRPLAFVMSAFMQSLRGALPDHDEGIAWHEYRSFQLANQRATLAAIRAGDEEEAVRCMNEAMQFWLRHPNGKQP